MKITAARGVRRIEVEERKKAWQAKQDAYEAASKAAQQAAIDERRAITRPVAEKIEQDLSRFNTLRFKVESRFDYAYDMTGNNDERTFIYVRVVCNENQRDESDALRWEYEVRLNNQGEVEAATGSWSGLNATTPAQLKSLRQTVMALEYLNSLDWKSLIDKSAPDTRHFYENLPDKPQQEDWSAQFRQADFEEIVGDPNSAILVWNWDGSEYWGRDIYISIVRESPAQYTVRMIPPRYKTLYEEEGSAAFDKIPEYIFTNTKRVKKSNLRPVYENDQPQYWDIPDELLVAKGVK